MANVTPARPDSALAAIRLLDDKLSGAQSGQEADVASWLVERHSAVEAITSQGTPSPDLDVLEELRERTRRIDDKFLHWRRAAIMELSLIDQHLRYLGEQAPSSADSVPTRIHLSA